MTWYSIFLVDVKSTCPQYFKLRKKVKKILKMKPYNYFKIGNVEL